MVFMTIGLVQQMSTLILPTQLQNAAIFVVFLLIIFFRPQGFFGRMWVMKEALEKAGKADRNAVAQALRTLDAGDSKYYPGGQLKFDEKGRRVGAGVVIVQWQNGVPVTVYPPELAQATPFWPKKSS